MDAMSEAHGSAFNVVEARWKILERDGEMRSELGQRRVRDKRNRDGTFSTKLPTA